MRVLVVYAHPVEGSFNAAVRDRAVDTLRRSGHEVDLIDLHAEGFDPVLDRSDLARHLAGGPPPPTIADHAARLRAADALVFVHPTWWGAQPAILKGWFDRVWTVDVAFALPPGADRPRPLLRNIRRVAVLTTHGSSKWVNGLQGEAGKRLVGRGLRVLLHPLVRVRWVAIYRMDRADAGARAAHLDRVERVLSRW